MEYKYPVYKPNLSGNEKKYVIECLETTWISSKGKFVELFEKNFANFIGVKNATGVFNGTVAIHLALIALGIGKDDEVICPTFTYIASANPITQVGAKVVFADSKRNTWQIDPQDIEAKITSKTKAIMIVHLYGHPCEMDSIMQIARKFNLFVIEDCAEAIGSEYNEKKVGSFGDISCFSFFGNKTITTGEGGMVLTNSNYLHERLVHFKGQGLAKYREYWHDVCGYNYRMTNIQAAIGVAQLEHIHEQIEKKIRVASLYQENLKKLSFVEFHSAVGKVKHTYWMNSILTKDEQTRDELRSFLQKNSIETRPTFFPIHTMPMYSQKYEKHEVAEDIALRGINLPSYPTLTEENIKEICDFIKEFYEK